MLLILGNIGVSVGSLDFHYSRFHAFFWVQKSFIIAGVTVASSLI